MISLIIPLPFGLALYKRENIEVRGAILAGFLMATIAVVCMLTVTGLHDRVDIVPGPWIEWREVIEYTTSIALAFVTGNMFGIMLFQASSDREPGIIATYLALAFSQQAGHEALLRRARTVQAFLTSMGILVAAGFSIYAGLNGVYR